MSKKVLVVLDPGHYPNYNKGAASGYWEGNKMYTLSQYDKEELEKYGIDVILTRKYNENPTLATRGQIAIKNAAGYDEVVFISNHSNGYNGKAYGVEAFRSLYLPDSDVLGKKLVEAIVGVMKATTKITYSRGVKTLKSITGADYYAVIRSSVSSARSVSQAAKGPVKYTYIIEHGFHDNKTECAFLNEDANLKKIAEAKARVIAEYFGLSKIESTPETVEELYRVRKTWADAKSQKGAYRNLDGAKETADENPGYKVFNSAGKVVYPTLKSTYDIALEVIAGKKWGNGATRKKKLTDAGYDYDEIQKKVNELL